MIAMIKMAEYVYQVIVSLTSYIHVFTMLVKMIASIII